MGLFGKGKDETSELERQPTFGPYRLHELINSGGMADLWLATNQQEETFALRLMHQNLRFDLVAKRRFQRGCEILSKIHTHSQVIGYYGHGKLEGRLYLVMEYVEGANMRELLHQNDPMLVDKVWTLLMDMAYALEQVHDSGFMHLDYKPENLLVSRNGQLRLVDFDLALPKPDVPIKLWKYGGTPAYMAPEQLLHQRIDHRADLFAFGVAAYELLTRQRPFPGETAEEILRKQLDRASNFVSPREYNPDLSVPMEKVILKCLERDPDKRYPHMSVLIRDLQAAP
ncbi:MAG TPA: serine/threonine-protein kinase [Candidatus Paceibacterota bacterium]|nr:serine/threonine-protein kinase [Verrucomicrobiota bacterium]HRY51870.1 serine/threonine-protein kinase [Candidatus Paceibacterota bacterium]HSA00310.1 serine/threonine-protein kinase [Candidatus Paceibacterota bacterium]